MKSFENNIIIIKTDISFSSLSYFSTWRMQTAMDQPKVNSCVQKKQDNDSVRSRDAVDFLLLQLTGPTFGRNN